VVLRQRFPITLQSGINHVETLYTKIKLERSCKRKLLAKDSVDENTAEIPCCSTDVTAENIERLTRSSSNLTSNLGCLFCDKGADDGPLHQVSSFAVDYRVRNCASILQDSKLLAKLSIGDLIATEAKYHDRCLVALYNRAASFERGAAAAGNKPIHLCNESLAFAQLVEYISELKRESSIAPVFKLSDLVKMYQCRLQQFGIQTETRVHSTRLKNKILAQFPGMTAQSHGKEGLLVFDEDIAGALSNACQFDKDVEAMILVKAAQIVRRDITNATYKFSGEFSTCCHEKSVPQSLTALTQMILEGASIDSHEDMTCVPAAQSIAQLIVFNSVKHTRKNTLAQSMPAAKIRHNLSRETPLSLYLALMLHAETRKRDLVDKLFHLGLCVSYDRVLQVSANLANRICARFEVVSGICPPPLRAGLFITAAMDNIDHNPGSATAVDAFHGTGISLVQHYGPNDEGADIEGCDDEMSGLGKTVRPLPASYTSLPPISSVCKDVSVPEAQFSVE